MPNNKTNRLWLARKRLGYEQKQVSALIEKTLPQISWWETGRRTPNLKPALKFSILYKLPIRILFSKCYQECLEELNRRAKTQGKGSRLKVDLTEPNDYCSYAELIRSPFMTDIEKERVRRHLKILMDDRRKKILHH